TARRARRWATFQTTGRRIARVALMPRARLAARRARHLATVQTTGRRIARVALGRASRARLPARRTRRARHLATSRTTASADSGSKPVDLAICKVCSPEIPDCRAAASIIDTMLLCDARQRVYPLTG